MLFYISINRIYPKSFLYFVQAFFAWALYCIVLLKIVINYFFIGLLLNLKICATYYFSRRFLDFSGLFEFCLGMSINIVNIHCYISLLLHTFMKKKYMLYLVLSYLLFQKIYGVLARLLLIITIIMQFIQVETLLNLKFKETCIIPQWAIEPQVQ